MCEHSRNNQNVNRDRDRQNLLLSIITVVYNDEQTIEQTVKSIIEQKNHFNDFEYVLIDGGSTDNTPSILEKYSNDIDILLSERDNGLYHAMNKAISLANGEWFLFINSGDTLADSNVLKLLADFVFSSQDSSTNANIDIIYGNHLIRRDYGKAKLYVAPPINKLDSLFWKGIPFSHQSCLMNRRVFIDQNNRFIVHRKFHASDYVLLLSLYCLGSSFKKIDLIISEVSTGGISDIKRLQGLVQQFPFALASHSKKTDIIGFYFSQMIYQSIATFVKSILPAKLKQKILNFLDEVKDRKVVN